MTSLAFLFPGQGSQEPGMGRGLLEDRRISELCDRCSEVSGVDLRHLLTQADEEELRRTENAQPALCFTCIALALLLRQRGVEPQAAAGHSVGEYAALCVAGALEATQALQIVAERGRAMAGALPAGESSMAAVIGLDGHQVEDLLAELDDVWPANFNTPTQTVIAGRSAPLETAAEALRQAGAKRVLLLNVSAAFHTPLMRPAAERLRRSLDGLSWQEPRVSVIANVDAEPYSDAAGIASRLERQLYSPVRWAGCITSLSARGVDAYIEIGPKRALSGMMRELAPAAFVATVGSAQAVAELNVPASA